MPRESRHPATEHLLDMLDSYQHLPSSLGFISAEVAELAYTMIAVLDDGPELTVGLRHLVDAKDALVRQRVIDLKAAGALEPVNTPEIEIRPSTAPFETR